MPSLLPGYEYDIFISYRQNDNRSGWVTEFVKALQEELLATIKDPVSVYFDTNPHDGLLETHDVNKSLEGKLKCLIFIPIISQTYCDPKSFAWQKEFCVFNTLAKESSFGRDIKLSNGNVACRILAVRIHDLDADDKACIESELGGVLRAVDFIYKEAGVNRPLRSEEENPGKNQNQTTYRNQINKVSNAIKELVSGMKAGSSRQTSQANQSLPPSRSMKKTLAWIATMLIMIFVASYFLYPRWLASPNLDKSIAVLPFVDLSPDHDHEYFGDGMAEEIINVLAQVEGLKVISRSSSFQFKGRNQDLREIGDKLGVATVLEGSVRRSGDKLRITAQLIKASDGSHIWSKNYDRNPADAIAVQDEIAGAIAAALKTTFSPATIQRRETWDEEAWKDYQMGRFYFDRDGDGDLPKAHDFFLKSIRRDSTHSIAWAYLTVASPAFYIDPIEAERLNSKALQLDSLSGDAWISKGIMAVWHNYSHPEALRYMVKALSCPEKNARIYRCAAIILIGVGRPEEALKYAKLANQLDPLQTRGYEWLSISYLYNKQYDSALWAANKSLEISPTLFPEPAFWSHVMLKQWKEAEALIPRLPDETRRLLFYSVIHFGQGKRDESDHELAQLKKLWEGNLTFYSDLAALHAFRNEPEPAMRYLEIAFARRALWLADRLKVEPLYDPLRKDPRFIEMIRQMDVEK